MVRQTGQFTQLKLELSKRFSFSVVLTITSRLVMAGNSVFAGLLIARLLGKDSLGVMAVISVAVSIMLQFGGFGLANANLSFAAQDEKNIPPAFINGTIFAFLSGIAFAGLTLMLAPWLMPGIPMELLAIALASIPFTLTTQMNLYLFLGKGQITTYNFLELANQSFVLINAIVVLLILQSGLWNLVAFNTTASALVSIVVSALVYKSVSRNPDKSNWRIDLQLFRQMMAFAIRINMTWVATYLIYRLDLLIVSGYLGMGETAVYSVASQVTLLVLLLPHSIATMFQHRVAKGEGELDFSLRVFRYSSFLMFVSCLLVIPGTFVLKMLYGPGFEDLPIQVLILVPGIYCAGMQIIISQPLVGKQLPINIHTVWIAILLINIVLNLALVPILGARGAAAISTFCYATVFIAIVCLFRHERPVGIAEMLVPRIAELRNSWDGFARLLLRFAHARRCQSRGG